MHKAATVKSRSFLSAASAALAAVIVVTAGAWQNAHAQTTFEGEPYDKDVVIRNLTKRSYSPYAGRNFPTRVYWGDTHLHTALSLDARAFGVTLGPEDAFRFARGEEITATTGDQVKLSRPLDFLVVSDHGEALGVMNAVIAGGRFRCFGSGVGVLRVGAIRPNGLGAERKTESLRTTGGESK